MRVMERRRQYQQTMAADMSYYHVSRLVSAPDVGTSPRIVIGTPVDLKSVHPTSSTRKAATKCSHNLQCESEVRLVFGLNWRLVGRAQPESPNCFQRIFISHPPTLLLCF
jgi:hypothetical protein